MKNFKRLHGFTLVELMVVLVVLAIISTVAIPSFNTMIKNNRIVTVTNDLNGTLQYARVEAVRRAGDVHVSAVDGDVAYGVRVWFDNDEDNNFDDDETLRELKIEIGSLALGADIGGTSTQDLDFTFDARGETSLNNTLSLELCDDREGDNGRRLELLVSGAIRLTTGIACNSEG